MMIFRLPPPIDVVCVPSHLWTAPRKIMLWKMLTENWDCKGPPPNWSKIPTFPKNPAAPLSLFNNLLHLHQIRMPLNPSCWVGEHTSDEPRGPRTLFYCCGYDRGGGSVNIIINIVSIDNIIITIIIIVTAYITLVGIVTIFLTFVSVSVPSQPLNITELQVANDSITLHWIQPKVPLI